MLRNILDAHYVPTLAIRPSEMRALQELPESDKDLLFPLVLLAPWATSLTLDKAIERVEKAYGKRPFFLDIDRYYSDDGATARAAQDEFRELANPDNGFERWYDFIIRFDQIIPTVRTNCQTVENLCAQLELVQKLGRGFAIRLDDPTATVPGFVYDEIAKIEHNNFIIILDSGWSKNYLLHQLWFSQLVKRFSTSNPSVAIVLSSSNFPKSFTSFEGVEAEDIGSRKLFSLLRKEFNESVLIYGDWGSTKPRLKQGGGIPVPRIDYPLNTQWIIARSKENDWDYEEAAANLLASDHWNHALAVWGSYMIEKTANGDNFGIDSIQKTVAARVNIHLHLQSRYELPIPKLGTDDPWVD
ncbi:beta family protein [Phyllobacterium ifriqiyense]|uniref:beta family protein n=1 Tax=Phyllobacterium ifriqiyense TaxID=314238 RepID=UPI003390F5E8